MKSTKPTRHQRQMLQKHNLDPREWYMQKDTPKEFQVVNIKTQEVKILSK